MPDLIPLLLAPILQIVLSILRIFHRVAISIIGIACICCFIGIASSFIMIELSAKSHSKNMRPQCIDCGAIYVYIGIITLIAVPIVTAIIALLAAAFYKKPSVQP